MTVKDNDIDDGLTDEERLALSDGEDESNEGAEEPTAGDEGTDPDDEAAAEAFDAKAADDAAIAATAAKADAAEAEDEPEAQQKQTPILVAPPPEDAAAKLTQIAEQKEALLTQFDDGDITMREYQKAMEEISKTERAIERAQDRADLAAQMERQRLQNDWDSTCNAFVEANAIYKDNPRLYKALDAEVRELAADPKTADWTGQRFLDEAHKNLKQAFGLPDAQQSDRPVKRAHRELPPNLAKVPAADVQDTNGGRFAVLDRMATTDPVGYEEALAKMPAAERDAYMAAG